MISQGYASDLYKNIYLKENDLLFDDFIERRIDENYSDLVSVYPFSMHDKYLLWSIPNENCGRSFGFVSGTFITNPLHSVSGQDCDEKYKEHYIVDLQKFSFDKLPENHKRNIKKQFKARDDGLGFLTTQVETNPEGMEPLVHNVYDNLIKRHKIRESAWTHYSKSQIRDLLRVPGAVLFSTKYSFDDWHIGSQVVNYTLFYIDGSDVYYHIGCQTDKGYEMNSNFMAIFTAIIFFKNLGLDRLLLGSVPDGESGEGLRRFKSGFSTSSKWNHIIKVIYNPEVYAKLSEGKSGDFFPAYRGI